mgnify:FL=1
MANATPQGMMDLILNTPRSPEVVETFRELLRTNPNWKNELKAAGLNPDAVQTHVNVLDKDLNLLQTEARMTQADDEFKKNIEVLEEHMGDELKKVADRLAKLTYIFADQQRALQRAGVKEGETEEQLKKLETALDAINQKHLLNPAEERNAEASIEEVHNFLQKASGTLPYTLIFIRRNVRKESKLFKEIDAAHKHMKKFNIEVGDKLDKLHKKKKSVTVRKKLMLGDWGKSELLWSKLIPAWRKPVRKEIKKLMLDPEFMDLQLDGFMELEKQLRDFKREFQQIFSYQTGYAGLAKVYQKNINILVGNCEDVEKKLRNAYRDTEPSERLEALKKLYAPSKGTQTLETKFAALTKKVLQLILDLVSALDVIRGHIGKIENLIAQITKHYDEGDYNPTGAGNKPYSTI